MNQAKTFKILTFIAAFTLSYACNNHETRQGTSGFEKEKLATTTTLSDTLRDTIIITLTQQILTALRNKDYNRFATFIHPVSGLRFSPYGYIDTLKDLRFSITDFKSIHTSQPFDWGHYNGSGKPIHLTIIAYFSKFVYDRDFLNAKKTSLNEMIGTGNSLNNLEEVYKNCPYTESYFPGSKKYKGMDWSALRLVFKIYKGRYYLVGIVHDQWTI